MSRPMSAVRNTCFAILSGIETDIREILWASASKTGDIDLMPDDVRQAARPRFEQDNKERAETGPENDLDLLYYTDFGDLAKMLNRRSKELSSEFGCDITAVAAEIDKFAAARNRVCHSRPLEEEDLPNFLDLAKTLLNQFKTLPWEDLRRVQEAREQDPSYVLRLEIPAFWRAGSERIHHNLDLPDYDETSFLGRVIERRELKKQLTGSHPVISVVGEGGVGKSALAIECCYELLDAGEETKYDAIVWVSLKTKALTANGIKDIRNAIIDTLGVIRAASEVLGAKVEKLETVEDLTNQLLEYMEQFRVLLVIDNFETLDNDALRPILSSVPIGSKVLITSRVGLGEIEIRYKLDALDIKTAVALMRRAARCLNLDLLSSASEIKLTKFCTMLHKNPLLIKWFVQSVASGADPDQLVGKESRSFDVALAFCFENLFSRLQESERQVLHVLASTRRGVTRTELLFLLRQISDIDETAIESALLTLHNSSMLRRMAPESRGSDAASQIVLTDVASVYLARVAPPDRKFFERVQTALKFLREVEEKSSSLREVYKYDLHSIRSKTRDQRIAASYLSGALDYLKVGNIDLANKSIQKAKAILPNYSETYRISALVQTRAGDYYKVIDEIETAITCDPESPVVHYQYGLFLLKEMRDSSRALEEFEIALKYDPENATLLTQRALALTWLGRCKEAAAIYEDMLKRMGDWARKWRISTRNQSAECYRRLAEQNRSLKDDGLVKQNLDRACHIIEEAWAVGDSDSRMNDLYADVIQESLLHAIHNEDPAFAIECLERLSDATAVAKIGSFRILSYEFFERSLGKDSPPAVMARQLAERIGWAEDKSFGMKEKLELKSGTIKAIPPNASYGFLTDTDGKDWFFHKSSLSEGKELSTLKVGQVIRFLGAVDEQGRTKASRVEVI